MTSFKDLPIEREETITFHTEEIELSLTNEKEINSWIKSTIQKEGHQLGNLSFIFCSDPYLHKINIEYLNHDTLTDVITFPYSESHVEGDIFISIDRIKENAKSFGVTFDQELNRVIIHGVLHLIGYMDKTPEEKKEMTEKENFYLRALNSKKENNQNQ